MGEQVKIDPIEGVDLSELVKEASTELMAEKRRQASNIIKNHLQREEQLVYDIRNLKKNLKGKEEKLAKAQAKIEKIIKGDWSLLVEKKDGPKGHNNKGQDE
jgi:seryl-tRNA synthetase